MNYQGEVFQLKGFRLPFTPVRSRVPVYVASLGPQNLRLTGELADGWLPIYLDATHLPSFQLDIERGAKRVGHSLEAIDVAPYILSCVSEDAEAARRLVQAHLAYYIGGMGTFYANLIARYGFEDEVARVRAAWARRDRQAAANQVSDAMVAHLAICGSPKEGRAQLERYRAAGVTLPIVSFTHGASRDDDSADARGARRVEGRWREARACGQQDIQGSIALSHGTSAGRDAETPPGCSPHASPACRLAAFIAPIGPAGSAL